jgi:glycosyltransferase involved in cell wall biosynthesis
MDSSSNPLRVAFCWAGISGYMAACWRTLSQSPSVRVKVFASLDNSNYDYANSIMTGIDWHPLQTNAPSAADVLEKVLIDFAPDVIVIAGWMIESYRELVVRKTMMNSAMIVVMDAQWKGQLRQYGARTFLASYLSRFSLIVVPGERSRQYARRLGFSENRIHTGLLGFDSSELQAAYQTRVTSGWPRSFLFAGRYVDEKAIDILIAAYRLYRTKVGVPWILLMCGKGPLAHLIDMVGVEDRGFQHPTVMPDLMAEAGCFILPSRSEAWGMVILEACASGLPVIATTACGATVECIRDGYNGFAIPADNVEALADALLRAHRSYDELPEMGRRSMAFAAPYSAKEWAKNWQYILLKALTLQASGSPRSWLDMWRRD